MSAHQTAFIVPAPAAYLSALPRHRYIGARVVELASGPGLAGLFMVSRLA